jgi:hypothetical protein
VRVSGLLAEPPTISNGTYPVLEEAIVVEDTTIEE